MKNIGKFVIILCIIFLVSGILATAFFFAGFNLHNIENSDYYEQINYKENASYIEINKVKLNFISEDIKIESVSGEEFIFNLSGYYPQSELGEYPELIVEKSGDILNAYIKYPQKKYIFGINSKNSNLYVGVPKEYSRDFFVESVSGEVEIKNVRFEEFEMKSVSGDLVVENSEFLESDIESISGEIFIYDSTEINSISSISGNIEINNLDIKRNLKISTVSGDVKLKIKNNSSIDLEFESISGDLENDFGEVYDGEYEINVETTSGDLRIY